jgi:hypothetical protein
VRCWRKQRLCFRSWASIRMLCGHVNLTSLLRILSAVSVARKAGTGSSGPAHTQVPPEVARQ